MFTISISNWKQECHLQELALAEAGVANDEAVNVATNGELTAVDARFLSAAKEGEYETSLDHFIAKDRRANRLNQETKHVRRLQDFVDAS